MGQNEVEKVKELTECVDDSTSSASILDVFEQRATIESLLVLQTMWKEKWDNLDRQRIV